MAFCRSRSCLQTAAQSEQASKTSGGTPAILGHRARVERLSTDVEDQAKGVEKMGGREQKTTI